MFGAVRLIRIEDHTSCLGANVCLLTWSGSLPATIKFGISFLGSAWRS